MTQIQIINLKRSLTGYTEVAYKMSFTLPAVFGTGINPIEGLSKIIASYSDNNFGIEVIPVVGTVITFSETKSPDTGFTLAQAKTFLQNRYSTVRGQLDSISLSVLDNLSGLDFDGSVWATTATITDIPLNIDNTQSNLALTATGIAGAAVTLTIPPVISKFHSLVRLEISAYSTVARVGNATPIIVTTANILGTPAFTFATAGAVGTTDSKILEPTLPIKSAIANTATTVVCPATASIIWRVNCFYNTSV